MAEAQFFVGVHGVIANRGRFLVLRRAERMPYQPGSWDLPGGHLAADEDFEQCLLREVKEETAVDVAIERLLGLHKSDDGAYVQAFFACRLAVYKPIVLRPDEHVESRWVTPDEAAELTLIPYLDRIIARGMLNYVKA